MDEMDFLLFMLTHFCRIVELCDLKHQWIEVVFAVLLCTKDETIMII